MSAQIASALHPGLGRSGFITSAEILRVSCALVIFGAKSQLPHYKVITPRAGRGKPQNLRG